MCLVISPLRVKFSTLCKVVIQDLCLTSSFEILHQNMGVVFYKCRRESQSSNSKYVTRFCIWNIALSGICYTLYTTSIYCQSSPICIPNLCCNFVWFRTIPFQTSHPYSLSFKLWNPLTIIVEICHVLPDKFIQTILITWSEATQTERLRLITSVIIMNSVMVNI